MGTPRKIYCQYASKDEEHFKAFDDHVSALKEQGFEFSHVGTVPPGTDINQETISALKDAEVILFFLSSDFMGDDKCQECLKLAFERQQAGSQLLLVNLRPVHIAGTPLDDLKLLPLDGRPITDGSWGSQDEAWKSVVRTLNDVVGGVKGAESASHKALLRWVQESTERCNWLVAESKKTATPAPFEKGFWQCAFSFIPTRAISPKQFREHIDFLNRVGVYKSGLCPFGPSHPFEESLEAFNTRKIGE